jgi:hypothetical protein
MVERNYDGVGSPSDLPSLDRNVGSWGKSGSRFRAAGCPFVALIRLSLLFKSNRTMTNYDAGGGGRPLHEQRTLASLIRPSNLPAPAHARAQDPRDQRPD